MGYQFEIDRERVEFNWVLKLKSNQGFPEKLELGDYEFSKGLEGIKQRIYPLNHLIYLVNSTWEAVALVRVLETKVEEDKLKGKYRIERILDEEEKRKATFSVRLPFAQDLGKKVEEIDWSNFKAS